MKKLCLFVLPLLVVANLAALEKKELLNVDLDEMTIETQPVVYPSDDEHMNLVWWIPIEFWKALFVRDYRMSQTEIDEFVEVMEPYTIFAVVQSDISPFGAFKFYSIDQVKSGMMITHVRDKGQVSQLEPLTEKNDDLDIILESLKPMLSAAMGNFGENFHFFVYSDRTIKGDRIADPYAIGKLTFELKRSDGIELKSRIETPLNSLFIPRICPNGRPAHVTWKYCPWTGEELKD